MGKYVETFRKLKFLCTPVFLLISQGNHFPYILFIKKQFHAISVDIFNDLIKRKNYHSSHSCLY